MWRSREEELRRWASSGVVLDDGLALLLEDALRELLKRRANGLAIK